LPPGSLSAHRDGSLHRESDGPADICHATCRAIRHDRHPMGRWVDLVAPKPGAQTCAILSRIGLPQPKIPVMIGTAAAATCPTSRHGMAR
jgi:hypothetical protein